MAVDKLAEYRKKRHFRRTPEPRGEDPGTRRSAPRFVIQEHGASSHHYDFRLEVAGVLRSWAVPKGPSTDPFEKRLAVPTEDHPLEYLEFEGVVPEGEYGAGPVIVWDTGTYRNLKEEEGAGDPPSVAAQLESGHATVWLEGEKIRGGYTLQRIATGEDERWLLIRMDDEEADARRNPVSTEPESVLTDRTLEDIQEAEGNEEDERKGEGDDLSEPFDALPSGARERLRKQKQPR